MQTVILRGADAKISWQFGVCRYVLLKERNMIMTMEEEYKRCGELFPNPERLEKVHNVSVVTTGIGSAHFYRVAACNAMHGAAVTILSVHLSVRPSVGWVYCDKTKWWTADILIPHELTSFVKRPLCDIRWCSVQGQPGAYLFKFLCRPGQSVLVFLAWQIATASLVPGQPCTEPLAVPTTAQWTFWT